MKREWHAILNRYGRQISVCTPGQEEVSVKVFLQPVLDRDDQLVPSPLGLRREEQMLYLGPSDVALSPGETMIRDGQARYEVRSTRNVEDGHHVWAILQRLEENA